VELTIDTATLLVLLIVFVATLIRSAFGFGEALIAVPLLAFCIPIRVAAPLAVLLSVTIAAIVVAQDWPRIQVRSAAWLIVATLPGLPLGVLLLASHHDRVVKAALGLVILLFAMWTLGGRKMPELQKDHSGVLLGCGFCAGVLGGAYGMNGPPLVMYGALRRWPAAEFRATLQGYFLPASALTMIGYSYAGLLVPAVGRDYLLSLPVMIPAVLLGRAINHRLHGDRFLKIVYAGLICIGALLVAQAVRGRV
jgi:uncharacterized membrane protein YfcA